MCINAQHIKHSRQYRRGISTQHNTFLGESIEGDVNEPVEPNKEDIRKEPFSLPSGFTWDTLNIENAEEVCLSLLELMFLLFVQRKQILFIFNDDMSN